MILEYAQLLSTAHRVLDGNQEISFTESGRRKKIWKLSTDLDSKLYSATHINHPSAIWARQSKQNYIYLCNLLLQLCEEYTYRYGKIHKVEREGLCYILLKNIPKNIPDTIFTEPTPAMPDCVKVVDNSIESYRNYYKLNKKHLASWNGKINSRQVPYWY